jgi:hypothetical protein
MVSRQRGSDLPGQVAGAPRVYGVCVIQSNEKHVSLTNLSK